MATFPTLAASILIVALCFVASSHSQGAGMPPPFTRVLTLQNPPMHGNDVIILQNLIVRSPFVSSLPATGNYDSATSNAVALFQKGNGLTGSMPGVFDSPTANLLLSLHSCDGTIDPGVPVGPQGYLYKLYIPLFNNRSVEVKAFLFDGNNTLLHQFRVRAHGHDTTNDTSPWPSYSNTVGLNQFTSNGNTPTGVAECDLNSPEGDAPAYGPFPVNRIMNGISGNAKFLLGTTNAIRTGILLHTGIWPGWNNTMDMPNSAGCVHAHPEDIAIVWRKLVSIGVQVRENPFGQQPYPFKPQGIAVIEQVGCQ